MNRADHRSWSVLACAGAVHFLLGTLYAWSVYAPQLEARHAFSRLATQISFGTTIAVFTIAMLIAGRLLGRFSPAALTLAGAVFYGAGYVIAAALGARAWATILGIGVLSGIGIGFGYVSALTAAVTSFPGRRGLVTGVVTAGFAASGGVVAFPVAWAFRSGFSAPEVFAAQGVLVALGLSAAALGFRKGVIQDDRQSATGHSLDSGARLSGHPERSHAQRGGVEGCEPLRSGGPEFPTGCDHTRFGTAPRRGTILWNAAGLFGSSFAGLTVIGSLASMVSAHGHPPSAGPAAVFAFALGNTIGRPAWGAMFDRFGAMTLPVSLGLLGCSVACLSLLSQTLWLAVLQSFAVGIGFASGFVLYAANLVRALGVQAMPSVYPKVFLAYGAAAVVGPPLSGLLFDLTGSSLGVLLIAATGAAVTGMLLALRQFHGERGAEVGRVGTPSSPRISEASP